MKKLLSLLLTVCICFSFGVMLTACQHQHTYKTEWSKDATHHWHDCEDVTCVEVSQKAEHVWNEGVVTTNPTANANGEKTFTCTVCNSTKGEPVEFTGISEEKWNAMISASNFENYTLVQTGDVVYEGESTRQDAIIKFTADKVQVSLSLDGSQREILTYTGEEAVAQKNSYEQIFLALLENSSDFKYDVAEKAYKNPNQITATVDMDVFGISFTVVMENGKVTLTDDGKLLQFTCEYTQTTVTPDGTYVATSEMTWVFSDYGTTVISETAE